MSERVYRFIIVALVTVPLVIILVALLSKYKYRCGLVSYVDKPYCASEESK